MKKIGSLVFCLILLFTCCVSQVNAVEDYNVDDRLICEDTDSSNSSRATGLIMVYSLNLSATGNTLKIYAETYCAAEVVKSGFKDLVVQRRKAGSTSWSDYYDYGDLYNDTYSASIVTTLVVPSGYQYRLSCKHYAKKSLLVTQSVSNTSNVVGV